MPCFCAGIGIYIQGAAESQTRSYSGVQGVQPSNTFATVERNYASTRVDVYCCSNATNTNSGRITIPNGYEYGSNFGSYGRITPSYTGCIQFRYYYNDLYYNSWYPSNYNYDGIHTCKLPDSNGNYLYENFGIYNEDWSSKWKKNLICPLHLFNIIVASLDVYQLQHSTGNGLMTLTCQTRNSPPSIIRWYKDNTLLDIDGSNYTMSVTVTDRHNSYFDITLKVCDTPMVGTYKCEAGNRFGMDYRTRYTSSSNGKIGIWNATMSRTAPCRSASPV